MENRFTRRILGTLAGLLAGFLTLYALELVDLAIYPLPTVDPGDASARHEMMVAVPLGAMLFVVLGWLAAPLAGTLVALRIDHWDTSAMIITAVSVFGGVSYLLSVAVPFWMELALIVGPVIGGTIGLGLSRWWLALRYARGRLHKEGRGAGG
ncbi:hypothetical protein BH09PSE4_BH09PSE4_11740 [soil metagenome]